MAFRTMINEFINSLKYMGDKVTASIVDLLLLLGIFIAPAAPVLMTVGMAIALDTYFAIWKVKYLEGNAAVTSKKMRIGLVPKAVGYAMVIISVYVLDWAIMNDFVKLFFPVDHVITKLAGGVLVFIEYTSMDESFYAVKGITIKEAFGRMLKTIRGFIRDFNKVKDEIHEKPKSNDDSEHR